MMIVVEAAHVACRLGRSTGDDRDGGRAGGREERPRGARVLCQLDEIPDGGSAAFALPRDGGPLALMAIRRGHDVGVHVNSCPHWGSPLDIRPGRFLDRTGTLIQCSTHGALFRIDNGLCVKGPCLGAQLVRVPVRMEEPDLLVIDVDAPPFCG
jgi:nitrite reductase/ring-hydroxylating ferredoxin subunit